MGSDSAINNDMLPLREIEEPKNAFSRTTEVFGNQLLLKEILSYLILNQDKKVSSKVVQAARLVNKSWIETTTTLLKKSTRPFIVLTLDENNSLDDSEEVKKNGKDLDQFVARFYSTRRLVNSFLPFKLDLTIEYFREENLKSLTNCLTNLGKDLIELKMTFPRDGGSMPFTFPEFTLPFLRKLTFQFSNQEYEKRDCDYPSFGNNRNSLWLLQLILNASEDIKEFVLPWTEISDNLVPLNFECLQLPSTILSLKWETPLKSGQLKILLSNQLLNLKDLAIRVLKHLPFDYDLLFRILDHFQKTLKTFKMTGGIWNGNGRQPSGNFRFPLMKTLEQITISTTNFEVDSQSLQTFLPKLKQIDLTRQTKALLENWIVNSKFENVVTLFVSQSEEQGNGFESIDLETMDQVHSAFPNVTSLTLTYCLRDLTSLKLVFENMTQLKSLNIVTVMEENWQNSSGHFIDSILLGVPAKLVEALSNYSDYVDSVGLKCTKEESIVNLSELVFLSVSNTSISTIHGLEGGVDALISNISDLTFNEGFFKMPKLRILRLRGDIQVSSKMVELWKKRGGLIECTTELLPLCDL